MHLRGAHRTPAWSTLQPCVNPFFAAASAPSAGGPGPRTAPWGFGGVFSPYPPQNELPSAAGDGERLERGRGAGGPAAGTGAAGARSAPPAAGEGGVSPPTSAFVTRPFPRDLPWGHTGERGRLSPGGWEGRLDADSHP